MESLYSGLSCFALICADDDSGISVCMCVGGGGGEREGEGLLSYHLHASERDEA